MKDKPEDSPEKLSVEDILEEAAAEAPEESKIPEAPPEDFRKKADCYMDQLLRLQAEFANYRKRVEKEKIDAIRFGKETMVEKIISLVDVMDSAIHHSRNATDIESLKKGFEMVVQEFLRFLKSEGAESLKTVGEDFDPHVHEAVEQVDTDDLEENNKVLEEVQKGYTLNGRLLRPARVKVAKCKKDAQK